MATVDLVISQNRGKGKVKDILTGKEARSHIVPPVQDLEKWTPQDYLLGWCRVGIDTCMCQPRINYRTELLDRIIYLNERM